MSHRVPPLFRRVFVDTSAHFALLDRRGQRHPEAVAIQNHLIRHRSRLFTTSFVLAETHALLLNRLGQAIAMAFLRAMEISTITVIWATPADVKHAREVIYRYDDKGFSLTDAISFVVMERLQIPVALAFDHHFAQYGLTVLTPDQL